MLRDALEGQLIEGQLRGKKEGYNLKICDGGGPVAQALHRPMGAR